MCHEGIPTQDPWQHTWDVQCDGDSDVDWEEAEHLAYSAPEGKMGRLEIPMNLHKIDDICTSISKKGFIKKVKKNQILKRRVY